MIRYPKWAIRLSERVNRLLGGEDHMTVCGQVWQSKLDSARGASIKCKLLDTLFFWDKGHCRASWIMGKDRQSRKPPSAPMPWAKLAVLIMSCFLAGAIILTAQGVVKLLLLILPYTGLFTAGVFVTIAVMAYLSKGDKDGQ